MVGVTAHTTPALQGLLRSTSTWEAWSREELHQGDKGGEALGTNAGAGGLWAAWATSGHKAGHSVGQLSQDLGGESSPDRGTNFLSWSRPGYALLLCSCLL